MRIKESQVEQYLVSQARRFGGKAWKWSSPGSRGVPDRIVFLPGAAPMFVEVKSPTGRLTELQRQVHGQLEALGVRVHVVYSKDDVDRLLSFCGGDQE